LFFKSAGGKNYFSFYLGDTRRYAAENFFNGGFCFGFQSGPPERFIEAVSSGGKASSSPHLPK
jgi:hypothetical protein